MVPFGAAAATGTTCGAGTDRQPACEGDAAGCTMPAAVGAREGDVDIALSASAAEKAVQDGVVHAGGELPLAAADGGARPARRLGLLQGAASDRRGSTGDWERAAEVCTAEAVDEGGTAALLDARVALHQSPLSTEATCSKPLDGWSGNKARTAA